MKKNKKHQKIVLVYDKQSNDARFMNNFFFNFFYIGNHINIFYKIFTLQQQYEINNILIKANGPKLNFKQTPQIPIYN